MSEQQESPSSIIDSIQTSSSPSKEGDLIGGVLSDPANLPEGVSQKGEAFFEVKLEQFDGPIDLLLHLVKERELQIERVSLAQVTQQYLHCIEQMRELDLDIAAEYLVVAATLVSIKAAALLADPIEFEATVEDNMPDPHRELLRKLREAQVFKDSAHTLATRKLLDVDVFTKHSSLSDFESPDEEIVSHDVMLLGEAFRKLLERTGNAAPLMQISMDSARVVERMIEVLDTLKREAGWVSFDKLVTERSKVSLICSFISLLELVKRRAIMLRQEDSFGEIVVALSGEEPMISNLTSEFDEVAEAASSDDKTVNA